MKRLARPLLAMVICCYGCSHQRLVAPSPLSADYKKGRSFLNRQDDSAFYYFNKVATGSKDSLAIATAYNQMALIQADRGDYYGSQETLLASLKYLNDQKTADAYCLFSDYNQLGRNSSDLKNYAAAIAYYDRALGYSGDNPYKLVVLNNKANAYQQLRQYDQAIALYDSILGGSKNTPTAYARVLTNLAVVRWLKDPNYPAGRDLYAALRMREGEKDQWGLNSSYAHLADYYTSSRPDSAFRYAQAMYAIAHRLQSPDDELHALEKLILLGPPRAVKAYFTRYHLLSDSIETQRNAAKNQFALIRYEAEKNKTENLQLLRDNAEKRTEILRQRFILLASVAGFVLVLAWLLSWFKRRRKATERKALDRIRDSRLQTSKKVHDVVANGLYRLMSGIEHGAMIDRDHVLNELEVLYEQSRDISHEPLEEQGSAFDMTITELLTPFAGPATRIVLTGNEPALWDGAAHRLKEALKPVLRELLVNMQKHSGAANVGVRFERKDGVLSIRYTDDGLGLPPDLRYGTGLRNTENRIKELGGRITFARNNPKGLSIDIVLPIG